LGWSGTSRGNAIRHGSPEFGNNKVVDPYLFGGTLRPPLPAAVPEIANQFLLLGIDRNRRVAGGKRLLDVIVDVVELGVAIDMVRHAAA
jgi:hypothetical protein